MNTLNRDLREVVREENVMRAQILAIFGQQIVGVDEGGEFLHHLLVDDFAGRRIGCYDGLRTVRRSPAKSPGPGRYGQGQDDMLRFQGKSAKNCATS